MAAASSISRSISAMSGCTVRTAKGRPTNTSATKMPSGVKATLRPSGASEAADPAVRGVERGQRDAGHRSRQREGQIDRCVEKLAAGETIARQHPGDEQAEDGIDQGGREGQPEADLQGREDARLGERAPEPGEPER